MKQALIVGVALAALVAAPALSQAQAKADFSGTWTLNQEKSDPAPARGGGGGGGRGGGRGGGVAAQMTIKQAPTQLSIDRTMGQGTVSMVYKLDGSESTYAMGMGEAKSKAMWEGTKLVITTAQTMPGRDGGAGMTMQVKEIYSLDAGALTIERTQTTPMGTMARKLVYDKGM
ncbi:MAG: hypothetical protein ND807_02355 [Vicinamibacterales bacterium]|nr:hypothetical protein [Vicinamibacterales bacterium]